MSDATTELMWFVIIHVIFMVNTKYTVAHMRVFEPSIGTTYTIERVYTQHCQRRDVDVLHQLHMAFIVWLFARYILSRVIPRGHRAIMSCLGVFILSIYNVTRNIDWVQICYELNVDISDHIQLPYVDGIAVAYSASSTAYLLGNGRSMEGLLHMLNTMCSVLYARSVYARSRPLYDIVESFFLMWEWSVWSHHASHTQLMVVFICALLGSAMIILFWSERVFAVLNMFIFIHAFLYGVRFVRVYDRTL
jgi:hypothetical protein